MKRKATQRATPPQVYEGATAAQLKMTCPTCGAVIKAQAPVEAFGQPPKWHFWGRPGERWRVCEGTQGGHKFVHFWTLFDGRRHDRLAWIKEPVTSAPQGTLFEVNP